MTNQTEGNACNADKKENPCIDIHTPGHPEVPLSKLGELEQLLIEFNRLGKLTTPNEWRVREFPGGNGDFFVEAPQPDDETRNYNVEILSDEVYSTKKADAEFIVAAKKLAVFLSGMK
jgi:hypothetical protein